MPEPVPTPHPDFWKVEIRPADEAVANQTTLVATSSLWAAELMMPLMRGDGEDILATFDALAAQHGHPDRCQVPWTSDCDRLADELIQRGTPTTRLFRFTPAAR